MEPSHRGNPASASAEEGDAAIESTYFVAGFTMGNVGFELALIRFPPMKSSPSLNGTEVLNSFSSQL